MGPVASTQLTMSEKLCLKWNDFQENISSAFGSLRADQELSDVTLACEDDQQVEAHRVILAASSPFFQNILKRNQHPHHLIYLRGLKSESLKSVIDYIYFGEASVVKENLENFMNIADELKLKGLTKDYNETNTTEKEAQQPETVHAVSDEVLKEKLQDYIKVESRTVDSVDDTLTETDNLLERDQTDEETSKVISDDLNETEYKTEINDLESLIGKVKTMIGIGQTMGVKQRNNACKVCGKESSYSNVRDHVETRHMNLSLPCRTCNLTFKSRNNLKRHYKASQTTS